MEQRIAKGLEILRENKTSSEYYELSTESIIRQIELWDKSYCVEVAEAGKDFVRLCFYNLTISLEEFHWEASKFCPQLVMQNDWYNGVQQLEDNVVCICFKWS